MRIESLESRLLLHVAHDPNDCGCDDAPADAAAVAITDTPLPTSAAPAETAADGAGAVDAAGDQMLPDIFPLVDASKGYVYGWHYDVSEIPGHTLLRLTTAMANRGAGPMDLRGGAVLPSGSQEVYQYINLQGGGTTSRLAGTFTYHPSHEHIHFDGFAAYRLRQVTANDGVGDVAAEGEKISFCLLDVDHWNPALVGSPSLGQFLTCGQQQGVSVGWADVYDQSLPDQWIDVTNVPDGHYWLEVVADPDNHLLESDETNNTIRIPIDLLKPSPDPMVVSSNPAGQYPVAATSVDFTFDQAMLASFNVADDVASFTGPGSVDLKSQITGASWLDDHTLRVAFTTRSTFGPYAMTIGPNILAADDSKPMDQDRDKVSGEPLDDRYTAAFNIDNRVGPDYFGYDARPVAVEDIDLVLNSPGVTTVVDNADDGAGPLHLGGNTFNFYGTTYTGDQLFANTNGLITVGSANAAFVNGDLTDYPANASIAPLWDDLRTDQTDTDAVLSKLDDTNGDGKPDRLIVEWSDVRRHSDAGPVPQVNQTFQAILTLNTGATPGAIVFNYRDVDTGSNFSNGSSATVGIKAAGSPGATGDRLLVSLDRGDNPLVSSGHAIRIARGPSAVVGRHLFYNRSSFDGGNAAANAQDDAAVAPDKAAYAEPPSPLTSHATFLNVSSYNRGINGVMVDLAGLAGRTPQLSDFEFRVGSQLPGGAWALAPAPTMSIRRAAGDSGADRVSFIWPDNAIRNTWLRVTVKATPGTGLASADLFYFGHLAGETGDPSPTAAFVGTTDLTRTRAAATTATATLASHYDFNRDGRGNAIDLAIVRAAQKSILPWLGTAINAAAPVFNDVPIANPGTRNLSTRRAALLLDDAQAQ